jgi:predicted Zn-dependent protease
VLAVDPMHIEAKRIRARARLARHEPDAALGDLDALLSAEPDDAGAHYLRGKALLALSRLPEARTEFDRASALSPQLLEAMLLRREAIRRGAVARAAAGEHVQPTHDDASAATEDGDLDAQLDVAAGASDAHLAALKLRDVGG